MTDLVADRDRLTRTFLRLAAIDSPALEEGELAKAVTAELEALGWQILDDGSGPQVGNLLSRRPHPDYNPVPVLLSTHLDVVEPLSRRATACSRWRDRI